MSNNSMDNKNVKNNSIWIVIAVVVAVIVVWMLYKNSAVAPTSSVDMTPIESTEDIENSTSTAAGRTVAPEVVVSGLSYQKALVLYKDKRIQLDKDGTVCAATPNNVTYKNGTTIMIDNRANEARTVKIGSTYTIKAYGFKLIKLSSTKLPVTWLVDCDEHQNVATVLIQK